MKKLLATIAFGFAFLSMTYTQSYVVQKESSKILWTGKSAIGNYALSGSINIESGNILLKNDTVVSASITIDMMSLNTENSDLKKHLRSRDFFEVKKFKQATFALKTASKWEEGQISLRGLLSIKDIKNEEIVNMRLRRSGSDWVASGQITLDRTAYGITYNSTNFFDDLKDQAIADEFILDIQIYFGKI